MDSIDISSMPPLPDLDYTQMILTALEELNTSEGLNKAEISSYIESNYPDLPNAHPTLLSNALQLMTQTGQLVFDNDSYFKPNPIASPKRGRGRPPKPKSDSSTTTTHVSSAVVGSGRPRGRPPKPRDPLAPAPQVQKKTQTVSSGRPRGRPRKNPEDVAVSAAAVFGVKRGRGRPPKST